MCYTGIYCICLEALQRLFRNDLSLANGTFDLKYEFVNSADKCTNALRTKKYLQKLSCKMISMMRSCLIVLPFDTPAPAAGSAAPSGKGSLVAAFVPQASTLPYAANEGDLQDTPHTGRMCTMCARESRVRCRGEQLAK